MYKKFQGYSSYITTLFRLPEQLKLPTPLPNFYEKKIPLHNPFKSVFLNDTTCCNEVICFVIAEQCSSPITYI